VNLLLDTCTFLWLITDDAELSSRARELFTDPTNDVYLSVISVWEIAIKWGLKRLSLPGDPRHYIPRQRDKHRIEVLELDEESALQICHLPNIHDDPFDRMLISQALVKGMVLVTPDKLIQRYPVRYDW
jgi:PIN domain nuclease of toxin-antitoxin system